MDAEHLGPDGLEWLSGSTVWPSRSVALLRYTPGDKGISLACNHPEIGKTIKSLLHPLSQLPAFGEHDQKRQQDWLMDSGSFPSRNAALTQIRELFARSGVKLIEAIGDHEWAKLKADLNTFDTYPAWHKATSEISDDPSSGSPEVLLQRSQRTAPSRFQHYRKPPIIHSQAPGKLRPGSEAFQESTRCQSRNDEVASTARAMSRLGLGSRTSVVIRRWRTLGSVTETSFGGSEWQVSDHQCVYGRRRSGIL
jgi:hypothetical protein